ncbi:MAG: GntR family transcriptional regulator [Azoarcus sp.]|jgi:hypothetical protein|nr:GntR family transcriptional regulator [Azoarcus sp.]
MTSTINATTRIFQRRTLCGALADSLRERLFAHEFPFRAPLDETALTAHYGVGHLPVTEALQQLFFERLLVKREQGGYGIPEYLRADIENLLETLEGIRRLALRQHEETARDARQATAVDMPAPSRPCWGLSGLTVRRPFAVAAQNLYDQLRLGIGPALVEIEARCAERHGEAMARAIAERKSGEIEKVSQESARTFRQAALRAFGDRQDAPPRLVRLQ